MTLIHLRQQIDSLDTSLVELLARRFQLAQQTTALKNGVMDAEREQEVRKHWAEEAKRTGLSPAFTQAVLELVLAESHRLQTRIA